MTYQLSTPDKNGPVLRLADSAYIPADPANRDWSEYLDWCDEGNKPKPYVPPPEPEASASLPDPVLLDHENRIRALEQKMRTRPAR